MAVIDFPTSPINGQLFNAPNGVTYRWQSTPAPGLWLSGSGVASVSAGVTPPSSPAPNALWWNSDAITGGGQLYVYYNDGNTAQWVPAATGGSPTTPGGDFCAINSVDLVPGALGVATVMIPTSIVSGNSGSWYSTSTGRFTPPAGRYSISASYTVFTGALQQWNIYLRKNGVNIGGSQPPYGAQTAPATNYVIQPTVNLIVDANGTDYFDVTSMAQGAIGGIPAIKAAVFSAYPLSGIKGPPGDIGAPVAAFNVRATTNDTASGTSIRLFRSAATPVKDHDPDNVWNLGSSEFTAPSTGRYAFQVAAFCQHAAAVFSYVGIQHQTSASGTIRNYAQMQMTDSSNYGAGFDLSIEIQMSAGEKVVFVFGTNSGNFTAVAVGTCGSVTSNTTWASGRKVV